MCSLVRLCACRRRTREALGDQVLERVQFGARDRFGRLDGGAAGEYGETCKALPLVVAEQVVTPVDRRAQRLLACGCVTRPGTERSERAVQACGDLGDGQHAAARGRQLDGQR
ncbi:MAG TPA: hypothetical protein VFG79_24310 [Solirubrobacter sp.]|jgi:hypothetical protein|nr:hypothetical protein [Solirubrobacter sp.]